jgi:hypothetical protein
MTIHHLCDSRLDRARSTLALLALSVFALFSISGSLARAADIGALNTFQPNTPALASEVNDNFSDVRTAVNTKQDESSAAGLDFITSSSSVNLVTSLTSVASVTVTIPAAGFVKVDFDTQSFVNHVTGVTNGLSCRLERNGVFLRVRAYDVYAAEQTGGRNRPMHLSYAAPETTPGSVTYQVRCSKAGTAQAQVNNFTLAVEYFEHRY